MNISFSPPDISEMEISEVVDTLRSGWITTGPRVKKLENKLADYVGSNKCACLSSNTACGETALRLLGIGLGDEVITCAYTYTATASVVNHVGATLKLVDCQVDSLEMDYDALENAITDKTKAIIAIDIAGIPCDYDRLFSIVERKKAFFNPTSELQERIGRIAIIADAAHALGAKTVFNGKYKMVGSIADISYFSFHAVKNFTTAEGGAITWTVEGIDDELYHQIQLYSLHGQSRDAFEKSHGSWEYDVIGPWYKCNMTDITAAIGLAQFERYPVILERRKNIIEKYDKAFKSVGIQTLNHYTDRLQSSGHLYITRIPNITYEQRQEIMDAMAERGIATNVHYKPLPLLTAYKNMGFDIENYPNAYNMFVNEITLPLYTTLKDEEVDYIIQSYLEATKDYL